MSEPTDLPRTPRAAQYDLGKHAAHTSPTRDQQPESSNSTIAPMSAAGSAAAAGGDDDSHAPVQAYAKLEGPDFCYYVRTLEVLLGRYQSADDQEQVDIDLGDSKAVSRRHAKIFYNFMSQSFELQVFGKNGCLVDDEYYARGMSVPLHHKMVIQIADIEFTFLLPKAAIPAAAASTHDLPTNDLAYPLEPAMPGYAPGGPLDADAMAAHGGLPPPGSHPIDLAAPHHHHRHPAQHHSHGTPPRQPPQPRLPPPPPHGRGYPVNAITPQRLNLYSSAPDASSRHLHYRPLHSRDSGPYANRSPDDATHDVRSPPAPLSFGDPSPQPVREPSGQPIAAAAPQAGSNSSSGGAPLTSPGQQKKKSQLAKPPPLLPSSKVQPAARTASSCMHILPATQKPGAKPEAPSPAPKPEDLAKPVYSYASLIAQAINQTREKKVTLNGIYTYITANYPYYRHTQNGWQNSIRHNLSLNKAFIRVLRADNEPGKGSYWAISDQFKSQFTNGVYKRTRRTKAAMEMERASKREQSEKKAVGPSPKSKRKKLGHGASASSGPQPADGSDDEDAGQTSPVDRRSQSCASDRVTGEKRPSPDADDAFDSLDEGDEGDDGEAGGASRGATPNRKISPRSQVRTRNHQALLASTSAMSTGDDDTVDYMSSAPSNNNESKPGSVPASPQMGDSDTAGAPALAPNQAGSAQLQMPQLEGDGAAEERRMPRPPANAMRSRSNSTRQSAKPFTASSPAKPMSPPTRASQPRAQKGLAR